MNASDSFSRANRATLNQVMQHTDSLVLSKNHFAKWLFMWLNPCLSAVRTAIPLLAFSIFAMFLGESVAVCAVHFVCLLLSNTRIAFCLSIVKRKIGGQVALSPHFFMLAKGLERLF